MKTEVVRIYAGEQTKKKFGVFKGWVYSGDNYSPITATNGVIWLPHRDFGCVSVRVNCIEFLYEFENISQKDLIDFLNKCEDSLKCIDDAKLPEHRKCIYPNCECNCHTKLVSELVSDGKS